MLNGLRKHRSRGREDPQKKKKMGGVPLPKSLTLFKTKIYDFPYPILGLDQEFDPLLKT